MSEQLRGIIALGVAVIILAIGYVRRCMNCKTRKQKFIEKAKEKGNYTTATLIKLKENHPVEGTESESLKYRSVTATYEYFINEKRYKRKITFGSDGSVGVTCPNTMTVYYKVKRPGKAVCAADVDPTYGCCGTIFIAILAYALVFYSLKIF